MAISPVVPSDAHGRSQANISGKLIAPTDTIRHAAAQQSSKITIDAKDRPLTLLLRSVLEKLDEYLAPTPGDNAIQSAATSSLDISPEATAGRIVSMSTGFFNAFKELRPGEDNAAVLESFMQTIGKGIEQGFADARRTLRSLNVLQGETVSNIDRTHELIQDGLTSLKARFNLRSPA